ncbi:MAG: DUF3786 domain-containing protein [Syntrophobacteraceae bacterium]
MNSVRTTKKGTTYEDPSEIDPLLWERLQTAQPEMICRNAMVEYLPGEATYLLPFLCGELQVRVRDKLIEHSGASQVLPLTYELHLVALHYLLEAVEKPLSRQWVSEKELPGGPFFFRGPHELPTKYVLKHLGARPDHFRGACEKLNGEPEDVGDAAYRFQVLPRAPMLMVFWQGDDEFGPSLNIQFDATVRFQLPALDVILAMTYVVARSLVTSFKTLNEA